jgi:tetratricopeptide (TPR) repeat protein
VHQFLRRLTGISAVALLGIISVLAQDKPADSGSAPAQKEKKVKDQGEYDLYTAVTKETDPNKKLALLNTWKEKYPDSDFKKDRLAFILATYQQLNQAAKMIDTAKEILAIDPKDITALYWIAFLSPTLANTSADALDTAEKAANGLLAAEKPATVKSDEEWTKAKAQTDAIATSTLGWVGMQRKNWDVAEQNFRKSLTINPGAAQVSYWLGTTLVSEKKPEKQSEALFHFARAAAFDGPGALNPEGRKKIDEYLTKVYTSFHGDTTGLAELKAAAKASPTPPAEFKIQSAMEVAAAREEELKKTNPALALWLSVRGQLLGPDGQSYFDGSMKGNLVKDLKGWVISAKPAVKSKELLVSMEGPDKVAEATLRLVGADGSTAAPLTGKPEAGSQITFEGVPEAFTKEPLMVTFAVEKSKITGLKEEKVAAPARKAPVHKKKS